MSNGVVVNRAGGCQAHTIESGHMLVTSYMCDVIRITSQSQRHLIPGYSDWHRSEYSKNSGKIRMEIVIYRRQRVDYGEQSGTTCLVTKFACCPRGLRNFLYNDFQLNVQELRLQAGFFKGLVKCMSRMTSWYEFAYSYLLKSAANGESPVINGSHFNMTISCPIVSLILPDCFSWEQV